MSLSLRAAVGRTVLGRQRAAVGGNGAARGDRQAAGVSGDVLAAALPGNVTVRAGEGSQREGHAGNLGIGLTTIGDGDDARIANLDLSHVLALDVAGVVQASLGVGGRPRAVAA